MTETIAPNYPRRSGVRKFFSIFMVVLLLILLIFFYWRYFYVFGEGVKAGELNFLVKKGYVFKTYEGKLIQSGIRSRTPGSVQSYEFDFSVANERIANQLMLNSGKEFELHYKEYMGTLPWRGHSRYIVDSVINMRTLGR
ncbi:hypothetical protein SAMN05444008_12821 [Cnuella takakiae]|uniref:6-phosphogluconate dehydrogenase n=1 Tax=Cnuella takakiae TaxID=1302690 RepID=A0A1M5J6W1_9BACT|nr:hypothetical protein [Cnuella takakiae]SHG35970.1 hypothetical protein SAMN05444008_12821 [Cnuella takakiae]